MLVGRARKLVVLVAVVLVVLVGLDTGARLVAQSQIASRAKAATGAQGSSAKVSGFPFLGHLLLGGSISGIDLVLDDVPVGTLQLQSVEVQLTDTVVDRNALFAGKVRLRSIAAATATVTVTAAELTGAVGEQVGLPGNGEVLVDVAGRSVPATVRILDGHVLVIDAAGVQVLSSDLSTNPLVPACGLVLTVGVGQLSVGCHVAPVPPTLLNAISGA
ncbi:MAG: hypothetical protein ACYDA2_07090 [Acidimicrobiales bacterium]